MRRALLCGAALAAAWPGLAAAQGLGDAASREKQRRASGQEAQAPKKVFTNEDLPVGGVPAKEEPAEPARAGAPDAKAGAAKTATAGDAAAAAKPAAPVADEDPLEKDRRERQRLEAEWRVRFANARERLASAEAAAWREVVRTEFYQGVPVQMKVREKVETPELVAARQAMADLEEEFRRTGLPPGWARER